MWSALTCVVMLMAHCNIHIVVAEQALLHSPQVASDSQSPSKGKGSNVEENMNMSPQKDLPLAAGPNLKKMFQDLSKVMPNQRDNIISHDNATAENGAAGAAVTLRCCKDFSRGTYGDESHCTFKHDCVKGHCAPEEPCVGKQTDG